MGNSSGCCINSSETLIKKGDQDLNSLNQINNKNVDNPKLVNEIESKSNTNEITNNNNIHNKNIQNAIHSVKKQYDSLNDVNKNNPNNNKANSASDSYDNYNNDLNQKDNSSQDKEKISKGLVKMELPEGDQYEGETKDGKPYGRGHYISASGEEREGLFIEGLLNGEGNMKLENGIELSGNFVKNLLNGEGKMKNPNGEVYTGEFRNGKKEGKGVLIFSNGDKYEGDFKNDKIDGKLLDYRGNYINEYSQKINKYGQILDAYGRAVNSKGELVDKYNNIIDENGVIIQYTMQKDGYYRSATGKIVDETGKAMIQQEDGTYIKDVEEIPPLEWHYDENGQPVINADYLEKYPDARSWIDKEGNITYGVTVKEETNETEKQEIQENKSIFRKLTDKLGWTDKESY